MAKPGKRRQEVHFLPDEPAPEDFFDTHSRIADAISRSLSTNPKLRTIGLLGRWGSGKSTVIHHLEEAIRRYELLKNARIFTYDAWIHQSEPIRRSFLEVLIDFLYASELTAKDRWSKELKILSGSIRETDHIESPKPSDRAKLALLSLLPLPVGLSLLDAETISNGFGESTTKVGEFLLGITAFSFVIPVFVLLFLFIGSRLRREDKEDSQKDEVLSIILNRTITNKRTTTLSSPEPTAIEFGRTFSSMIDDLVSREYRLICVIDNLDRLPTDQAIEIWAAIRSLFLDNEKIKEGTTPTHPVVIVPMDRDALMSLFRSNGSQEDDERAASFIDKTFDLTFRVPPPVRSDWKDFLKRQMESVFGRRLITDRSIYLIERVFDEKYNTANRHPTPRIINRFVNAVGTAWLSRREERFSLSIVSLFVANFDAIDVSVLEFTQRQTLEYFDADYSDWRDQIAALYFGVPRSKSRQVLLEGPLKAALSSSNGATFKTLMKYPGSFKVFDDIIRNSQYDRSHPDALESAFRAAPFFRFWSKAERESGEHGVSSPPKFLRSKRYRRWRV